MQLTLNTTHLTPHGASRLVQVMSAWSVKTRRAPSRHCRDARVYGHTTTAMHGMRTPPPRPTLMPHCPEISEMPTRENVWLPFIVWSSILNMILCVWAVEPSALSAVYSQASKVDLGWVCVFSFLWGSGTMCFSLGIQLASNPSGAICLESGLR